jgi:5-methylcytosine-specific restriction endonuclease McrA
VPIRPEMRPLYGKDWAALSRRLRSERAGNCCEWCGVANGQLNLFTGSRVVLTVAHLDQNPRNNAEHNLAVLCQKCHLNHDRPFNLRKIARTRELKRLMRQPTLFAF